MFDPTRYPKSYRRKTLSGDRVILVVLLAVVLFGERFARSGGLEFYIVGIAAWLAFFVIYINHTKTKVTLYADRIEIESLFRNEGMLRSNVARYIGKDRRDRESRFYTAPHGLTVKGRSGAFFVLPHYMNFDDDWDAWMDFTEKGALV